MLLIKHVQTEESETVAAGKVGQKRRAVLQEVDVNRKSRRGSGGAVFQSLPCPLYPLHHVQLDSLIAQ